MTTLRIEIDGHELVVKPAFDYELRGDSWHVGLSEVAVKESAHPSIPAGETIARDDSNYWDDIAKQVDEAGRREGLWP